MTTVYPSGQITPYGAYLLMEGVEPQTTYTSFDGTKRFYIRGGQAPIPLGAGIEPGVQNGVVLQSISGMAPPFKHLDLQGSRQDGVTNTDTLYDAAEIDCTLVATAASAAELSQVVRDWIAANDPKKPGILEHFTPEMGHWWCNARLFKTWPDQFKKSPRRQRKQVFTHAWRNDDAFWQSVPSVDLFRFTYNAGSDAFERTSTGGLGGNWAQTYSGAGTGVCGTDGHNAFWYDAGALSRDVVNRYIGTGSTSTTDNQVVSTTFAWFDELDFTDNAYNDIWARMDASGNGIRARIGPFTVTLSRFNAGVETVMRQELIFPAFPGEQWTLVAGFENDPRHFKVLRNGFAVLDWRELGTGSALGASFRGYGFGLHAGVGTFGGQVTPAAISDWSAGDNATVTQSGFIGLINIGDQDGWPSYTCYGPGVFSFGQPGTTTPITFGPLLDGQIVQITTHPRLRTVVDETVDPVPLSLTDAQKFLDQIITLVSGPQVPPLLRWFESLFGIPAPQGVLYSLLNGRFSIPIPGAAQPSEAETTHIPVTITSGNANSKLVASVTPLRRYPE